MDDVPRCFPASEQHPSWTAYTDMSIEIISRGDTWGAWLAPSGFCTPVRILTAPPPTGRTLTLPGASFTRVEGDKIRYERVYTDRQTVTEQLGFTPKKT